ncbi:dihydroxyacetone kinase subunit DhaL [Phytohabitans sp. ZYX-F-186]|uniref:Dihydroxyacetone kinase subunit DhaL n=1 Tax=Phytohabitans maris TaxID=3071409 RepID=A0ABU0ZC01_9ACTN|nr:dihydroxyacetone kinase subunit DhaL [Phytohabitans sp. ZYX-F-186]MDQ7904593.1 dihydroxyacetone kinase subunit DhaL [Phytohabitans sp. ZYX-F-186]
MDVALARSWIAAIAAAVAEQADYLTQLDSAIGDADHGVNLNRGFTAVAAALSSAAEPAAVGDVFVKTGTTLVSKVGGAAGPLYGTAFRAIGKALPAGSSTVDAAELGVALRAGLAAVQKLGAAVPGDKTIVDAYGPAVAAFEKAAEEGLAVAARAAAEAAAEGMRATIEMVARKGRASYLGPRSVGHQDPGATSTWLVFQALADVTR